MSLVDASNLQALRPHSRGITFAVRPQSAPHRTLSRGSCSSSVKSSSTLSVLSAPDHTLTFFDIEHILYQKVSEKEDDLRNAFQTLDADQNFTVTKGEFRRVIETFLLPLTQAQFDTLLTKIPVNSNGTISYLNFLEMYGSVGKNAGSLNRVTRSWSTTNQNMTLNQLEYKLKNKISANLKNVVRSFRLFDYNQHGHLQRHELRRILENYCFKMKDAEFEKLWNHYCLGKRNTIDYKYLLKNIGINVDINKRPVQESVQQVLNWEATRQELQKQNIWHPPSSTAEITMEDYAIDEIEMAFRKKISINQQNLVKAFRAFDVTHSGFISMDAIKSVINSFIFPLPNGLFQELMNRFGFKENCKVAWEQFLEKCQDPIRFENGQKIRSCSRVNPDTGLDDFPSDHVLKKLKRHIQEVRPSLKKALLVLDDNCSGKITRTELRRIVDCIMFRITDDQFKELMIILDAEHTGFINYHQFLELCEEKVSSVEDILRDKIIDNLKDFQKAVQCFDSKGKGVINRNKLRKIIMAYCPSLSEEHFNKLFNGCCDDSSNGIHYMELLKNLGVVLQPAGDTASTDTQIIKEKQWRKEMMQADISDRKKETMNHTTTQFKKKSIDGAIRNLKQSLARQKIPVENILLSVIRQPNGEINKTDFRKVLEDNGMCLDDEQFNFLADNFGFTNEGLSYLDFASLLEDPQQTGPGVSPCQGSNNLVNNSTFHHMTAEECLGQLRDILRQVCKDTYAIFCKTDSNHDGIITMHDFRHLLECFVLIITDKEYLRLLDILGLDMSSTLTYMDFLELFQTQEKKKANRWLNLSHRSKCTIGDTDLACEQAHHYLVTKVQNRWHDLAKTFREFDHNGETIVQKKDLRNLFYRFALPIAPNEFGKLWARYDTDGKGYLTQEEFMKKLGVDFNCADSRLSMNIVDNCTGSLEQNSHQQELQAEMDEQLNQQTEDIDVKEIVQQIKDTVRPCYHDFSTTFAKMDKNEDGFIAIHDLQRLLKDHHCYLDDKQFVSLLYRLGITVHNKRLSYFDFLRMIDEDKEYTFDQRQQVVPSENLQMLSPEKALTKIKEIITSSHDVLYKAFSAFDKENNGTVSHEDFLQLLESFCFKLTEKQLRYLRTKLKFTEDHAVDWKAFLKKIKLFNAEAPAEWFKKVEQIMKPKSTSELSMKDIETRIEEVVTGRFCTIAQEFIDTDFAKINVISKEDFRDICNRNFMFLTDGQFQNLWNILPINAYGNLKYHEFLKKYNGEATVLQPSSSNTISQENVCKSASPARSSTRPSSHQRRPKTAPSVLRHSHTAEHFQRPRTAVPCSAPLLNCEAIEMKLRKNLHKTWQDILKSFREKDTERLGEITVSDLLAIGEKFSMDLSKEEFDQLTEKYDIKNNGKFSYHDFLRNVVLVPKQENTLLQRMKLQKPRIPMSTGTEGPIFVDAILRIQPKILQCWRPMRRSFLSFDAGTGYISVQDFKQVLRQYSINLSEEEFFHILGFYDKDLSSKISYNDFLRSFLR